MKPTISARAAKSLGAVVIILFLSACIPSLQPLYTEKDLVFEKGLIGTWAEKDDSAVWTFSKSEGQAYALTIQNKDESSPLVAHLFKLNGQLFLDLYPDDKGFEDWKREAFFKAAIMPGHLFFKVGSIEPKFQIYAMQSDWLKTLLEKDPKAVPHSKMAEDRFAFTGSTDEMQSFLKKYQNNQETWGDPGEFTRKKDSAAK